MPQKLSAGCGVSKDTYTNSHVNSVIHNMIAENIL